jgi:hypothetical protein
MSALPPLRRSRCALGKVDAFVEVRTSLEQPLVPSRRGRASAGSVLQLPQASSIFEMDDTVKAVLEKYSWEAYPSKHLKYFEIGAFDLETSLATDEVMHVTDQDVTDSDCVAMSKALEKMRPANLKHIYMSNNKVGDEGVAALAAAAAGLQNFELFYMARNNITDAGCAAIAKTLAKTKIWQLVLTENKIGDAGVSALAEAVTKDASAFSSLKWLFLDSTEIGDKGVTALAGALEVGMKSITRLALQNTKLTNRSLKALVSRALPSHAQRTLSDAPHRKPSGHTAPPRHPTASPCRPTADALCGRCAHAHLSLLRALPCGVGWGY